MMKIYYDPDRALVFISGATNAYSPRALLASVEGDTVSITLADGSVTVANRDWREFADHEGNGFENIAALIAYLDNIFAQGVTENSIEEAVTRERYDPVQLIEAQLHAGL